MKKAFSTLNENCAKNGGVDKTMPALLGYTGESGENLEKYRAENTELWSAETADTLIGAAIGVHIGPGAVAAAFFSEE